MLEDVDEAMMHSLMISGGKEVDHFDLTSANSGDLVRVTTMSGNTYLLEVTDPSRSRAHLVRCEGRHGAPSGYRGEREITSPIIRGIPLLHNVGSRSAHTSSVMKIFLLSPGG